jgi:hypothetical protein
LSSNPSTTTKKKKKGIIIGTFYHWPEVDSRHIVGTVNRLG